MQLLRIFFKAILTVKPTFMETIVIFFNIFALHFISKTLRVDYSLFKPEVNELILLSLFQIPDMLSFKATKKMQQKHPIVSCKKYICFSTARINFKRFVKPNYVTYAKQKLHFSPSLFFLEQNGVHQNDENSRKYSFPAQLFSYF